MNWMRELKPTVVANPDGAYDWSEEGVLITPGIPSVYKE